MISIKNTYFVTGIKNSIDNSSNTSSRINRINHSSCSNLKECHFEFFPRCLSLLCMVKQSAPFFFIYFFSYFFFFLFRNQIYLVSKMTRSYLFVFFFWKIIKKTPKKQKKQRQSLSLTLSQSPPHPPQKSKSQVGVLTNLLLPTHSYSSHGSMRVQYK